MLGTRSALLLLLDVSAVLDPIAHVHVGERLARQLLVVGRQHLQRPLLRELLADTVITDNFRHCDLADLRELSCRGSGSLVFSRLQDHNFRFFFINLGKREIPIRNCLQFRN